MVSSSTDRFPRLSQPSALHRGLSALCALVLAVSGCTAPQPRWADRVTSLTRDSAACATAAPGWFCANLASLAAVRLEETARDGRRVQVRATWRAAGDERDAVHTWWVGLSADGTRADDVTLDADGLPPLWALEPVSVRVDGPVTVIAGPGADIDVPAARQAVSDVIAAGLGPLAEDWSGAVVVEVPSSTRVLARMVGRDVSGMAAYAWPWGPDPAAAAMHVVVNPAARPNREASRYLLAHEITHIATRSVAWRGPAWIREGLAEWVATTRAGDVTRVADVVRRDVAAHGMPTGLPDDAELDASSPRIGPAYAHAEVAVAALVEAVGQQRALTTLRAWSRGEPGDLSQAEATTAYLRALRRLLTA